jgi:hypothetical protein
MITVYAKADCGCCTVEMKFKDEDSAVAAFTNAGTGNGMVITDDESIRHEGIDTFYGFSMSEEEQAERSVGFLMNGLKEVLSS